MDREDWLEGGEVLLESVGFLRIGSLLNGEGLLDGAVLLECEGLLVDSLLKSDLLGAEWSLQCGDSLRVGSCPRGEDLLGGEGDDDLSPSDCDAHLWSNRNATKDTSESDVMGCGLSIVTKKKRGYHMGQ